MAQVSVIMPVYNSAEFVPDAARSVLEQDYDDFELVLVDDGSTDGSGTVCNELAAQHANVRVLHKPNGGMCSARNYALDRIETPYVAFCDNDDHYLPHLLRDNMHILTTSGADCVYYGRQLAIYDDASDRPRISVTKPKKHTVLRGQEIRDQYDLARSGSDAVWACIYRREVIERAGLRFDERLRHGHEDTIFTLQFLRAAEAIALNPQYYYVWMRRTSHSSSFSITDDLKLGYETAVNLECALIEDWDVARRLPDYCSDCMARYLLNPLETAMLAGNISYKQMLPLYEWLHDFFAPRAAYFQGKLAPSRRAFCSLILKGHYRLAYACMRAAQVYVAHTKRG